MAKLTLEQKIAKIEDAIAKEELLIEESKKKIKKFKSELKTAKSEKEQSFANEILKLMKSKGISQENLIAQLKSAENQVTDETLSSPNVTNNSVNFAENNSVKDGI